MDASFCHARRQLIEPLITQASEHNRHYLMTKKVNWAT